MMRSLLEAVPEAPTRSTPAVDLTTPRPHFSARRTGAELTAPLRAARERRLRPRQRHEAERKIQLSEMHSWISTHSLVAVPTVEISKSRKAELRECFNILDADGGGSIGLSEFGLAMKALGFSQEAVKAAVEEGDRDGDGELNFEVRHPSAAAKLRIYPQPRLRRRRSLWRCWRARVGAAAAAAASVATRSPFP